MIKLLKYIQPISYLQIHSSPETTLFKRVYKDNFTEFARIWEIYNTQPVTHGLIQMLHKLSDEMTLEENYALLVNYLGKAKAIKVCFLRIITNPFRFLEFILVWKTTFNTTNYAFNFNAGTDSLQKNTPLEKITVSVIIPTLNRRDMLLDLLEDLDLQIFRPKEILVLDQSNHPLRNTKYKNTTVLQLKKKGLWNARNMGIRLAKGSHLLFLDDDSRVAPDFIKKHVECFQYYGEVISCGVDSGDGKHSKFEFINAVRLDTGNVCFAKEILKKTGVFDEKFEGMRMGDGEFGARCVTRGLTLIQNNCAKRIHLKAKRGGLRYFGMVEAWNLQGLLSPNPVPSVLYYLRMYFRAENILIYLIQTWFKILVPHSIKNNRIRRFKYELLAIPLLPLLLIQVFLSWRISSQMLNSSANV